MANANATETTADPTARNFDLLLDIPLDVTVELGRARLELRELLALASGSVVELGKLAGEPLDVLVNGKLVARGECVVVNDKFGVRLTDIVSRSERLARLA
jgi:flagellar motor switch protein FliN/FliY